MNAKVAIWGLEPMNEGEPPVVVKKEFDKDDRYITVSFQNVDMYLDKTSIPQIEAIYTALKEHCGGDFKRAMDND